MDRFKLKIPGVRGGGVFRKGRGQGAGRMSAANWGVLWWGGGATQRAQQSKKLISIEMFDLDRNF